MFTIPIWLKSKKHSPGQGFTMLEVLLAILMTTAFVVATMELMVVNVIYKVRAERQAQAMFWIQEDKEQIKARAATVTNSAVPYVKDLCSKTLAADKGYAQMLRYSLAGDKTAMAGLVTDTTDKNAITASTNTVAPVNATVPQSKLLATNDGQSYTLDRQFTNVNSRKLKIAFTVYETTGLTIKKDAQGTIINDDKNLVVEVDKTTGNVIRATNKVSNQVVKPVAQTYDEVIPDAVYSCDP